MTIRSSVPAAASLRTEGASTAGMRALSHARTVNVFHVAILSPVDIGGKNWITCFFPRARFGVDTTNMAESANSWILDDRDDTWFGCLSGVARRVQQRMFSLRAEHEKIPSAHVPWVEARLTKAITTARKRLVAPVTETVFEVKRESTPTYAVVDIDKRSCSCNFWGEIKYPCVHACAAILFLRKNPIDYISTNYSTERLRCVAASFATPVDVSALQSDNAMPPQIVKRRGRPKKVRIRNRSEYTNDDSPVHCGDCGEAGHNVRTCKRRAAKKKK